LAEKLKEEAQRRDDWRRKTFEPGQKAAREPEEEDLATIFEISICSILYIYLCKTALRIIDIFNKTICTISLQ